MSDQKDKAQLWPHAPVHKLSESGTFIVTVGTYNKQHFLADKTRLTVMQRGLLTVAEKYQWQLEAWAVFSNHYHFVGHSPAGCSDSTSLSQMLGELHGKMSHWINKLDGARGRRVWHNYWESRITYEKSYFARLNYVHKNAVKHGLVQEAKLYPWCSASWFEDVATAAQVNTIYSFDINKPLIHDEYDPVV